MGKKIKYQGGLTKLICQWKADKNKKAFLNKIEEKSLLINGKKGLVDLEIYSLSGTSSFEDQILSIFSFIFYVGLPLKWIIYSDKTYKDSHIKIFEQLFPFVTVKDWDIYSDYKNNPYLSQYLKECHLGKKLNIIAGHPYHGPTLYLDSDIIFYNNAHFYFESLLKFKGLWYTADTTGENLEIYFNKVRSSIYSLNSGMLFLDKSFNKENLFEYLEMLKGNYQYFTEQSSVEYAMFKQNANLLDPRQFIVDSSDQFDFSYKYQPHEIAMRHYVGPIRHKMWQNGWAWHLRNH